MYRLIGGLVAAALLLVSAPALASDPAEKVRTAAVVLEQIMAIPEQAIPPQLLGDAHGVAIIPDVIKAGFVVGGRHGRGIMMVRQADGEWSNPLFVSVTGGSIGWQIGAQSTDLILVFKTPRSVEGILRGKFTLGADAAIAAGPVGRRVEGATDAELKAEIVSYSRSRGLFAGISLEGASLQVDDAAIDRYYGQQASPREILGGQGSAPPEAQKVKGLLQKYAARPKG